MNLYLRVLYGKPVSFAMKKIFSSWLEVFRFCFLLSGFFIKKYFLRRNTSLKACMRILFFCIDLNGIGIPCHSCKETIEAGKGSVKGRGGSHHPFGMNAAGIDFYFFESGFF